MKGLKKYKNSYTLPPGVYNWSRSFNFLNKINKKSGRNNQGRICIWNRGGGHKKKYRPLDFKNQNRYSRLISIEYDPNRSCFIGFFFNIYKSQLFYDLVCEGQEVGGVYKLTENINDIKVGNKMPLSIIPLGTLVNSLEYKKGKGSQFLRSAGVSGKLLKKSVPLNLACLKMPSKKYFYVSLDCYATIGIVSNSLHKNKNYTKAGRNRWLDKRPTVRGVAMNPADHPHGGGEGKTSGGRPSVTPWGRLTKGKKSKKHFVSNPF